MPALGYIPGELIDALRIVERGDIAPSEMRGAWAGEIGQTQFMPSNYMKYAVDFDGNGRRDLLHSAPDVLASTANYLAGYGWQRGKDWDARQPEFRCDPAMEQERRLRKDDRVFRHPAPARALKQSEMTMGRSQSDRPLAVGRAPNLTSSCRRASPC